MTTKTRRAPKTARKPRQPTAQLYLAYGSNLNKLQMSWRCPDAVPVGTTMLDGWRLVFRGVADVERADGRQVPLGVWRITEACERELDLYEGCRPDGRGLYRKEYITLEIEQNGEKRTEQALIYVMNDYRYSPPGKTYLDTIKRGYRDFGLNLEYLAEAQDDTIAEMRGAR